MKKEYRNAIAKAIQESDLNGYKWTITADGVAWSYMDGEAFVFTVREEGIIYVQWKGFRLATVYFDPTDEYADCKTLEEAYYLVTKQLIRNANHTF